MHFCDSSRDDVNSTWQNTGSVSPHGSDGGDGGGGGGVGGGDGGGPGHQLQVPWHFKKNSCFLQLADLSMEFGNFVWQNTGSASPHGSDGGDGIGDGGGSGGGGGEGEGGGGY